MAYVAEHWHFDRLIFFFSFFSFSFFFYRECSTMIPFVLTIHDCEHRVEHNSIFTAVQQLHDRKRNNRP